MREKEAKTSSTEVRQPKPSSSAQKSPPEAGGMGDYLAQPDLSQPLRIDPHTLLRLQRTAGNQSVTHLLAPRGIQRTLGGDLSGTTTGGQLKTGLSPFDIKGVKFSEWQKLLDRLIKAPKAIHSFADAAIFLFENDPNNQDAVKKAIEAKKRKDVADAAAAELARKRAALLANYPRNTIGIYYRGDGRPQNDALTKGLTPFKILTLEEVRLKVQRWFGRGGDGPVPLHRSWVSQNTDIGPAPQGGIVATGNDIGCAGYGVTGPEGAVRNVYQIHVAGLQEVQPTREVLGVEPHPTQGPTLIMNAPRLADATIIAVKGVGATGHETSFFTALTTAVAQTEIVYEAKDRNDGPGRGWVTPL